MNIQLLLGALGVDPKQVLGTIDEIKLHILQGSKEMREHGLMLRAICEKLGIDADAVIAEGKEHGEHH